MEIAGPVEPCLIVEVDHVDDERVALPAAARVSEPPFDLTRRMWRAVREDVADGVHVLVQDSQLVRLLDDLERKRHVHDARHARQVTLGFRVQRGALFVVLLLLCQRPRLIRDLVAFDHALPAGHPLLGRMILNVPCRRVHDLPDPRQVGLAVGCARDGGCSGILTGAAQRRSV